MRPTGGPAGRTRRPARRGPIWGSLLEVLQLAYPRANPFSVTQNTENRAVPEGKDRVRVSDSFILTRTTRSTDIHTHTYIHTYTHTYTHTYIHTCTHIHTYIHRTTTSVYTFPNGDHVRIYSNTDIAPQHRWRRAQKVPASVCIRIRTSAVRK